MAEAATPPEQAAAPQKRGIRIFLLAALAGLLLGAGAFYAIHAGLVHLPFGAGQETGETVETPAETPLDAAQEETAEGDPAFVTIGPLVISLGEDANARHLKIAVALDVDPDQADEVAARKPRVEDVLNGYLRAVDAALLEHPREMARLRAQMLRRVRLVSPAGAVRDLLIQEFILN